MYCETCQADVAAEISADGKALLCTVCGGDVKRTSAPSLSSEAQSARELLDRWSRDELLDPYAPPSNDDAEGPTPAAGPPTEATQPPAASPRPPASQRPVPKFRIDAARSGPPIPASRTGGGPRIEQAASSSGGMGQPPATPGRSPAAQPPAPKFRIDTAHDLQAAAPHQPPVADFPPGYRLDAGHQSVAAPHFATESFEVPAGPRPGRFESIAGQLLAYGGVALLTVGTALVLFGYFGGPQAAHYTATGWLVATIGQMLLFLGVVTLISGGMQQTTHEVGSRVQYLGERLIRLESREPLRGPHFARARTEAPATVQAVEGFDGMTTDGNGESPTSGL